MGAKDGQGGVQASLHGRRQQPQAMRNKWLRPLARVGAVAEGQGTVAEGGDMATFCGKVTCRRGRRPGEGCGVVMLTITPINQSSS